jgi:hypothetical protein
LKNFFFYIIFVLKIFSKLDFKDGLVDYKKFIGKYKYSGIFKEVFFNNDFIIIIFFFEIFFKVFIQRHQFFFKIFAIIIFIKSDKLVAFDSSRKVGQAFIFFGFDNIL